MRRNHHTGSAQKIAQSQTDRLSRELEFFDWDETVEIVVQGFYDEQVYRDLSLVSGVPKAFVEVLWDSYCGGDAFLVMDLGASHACTVDR
jgi:hypothetical protein